jgi:linoleoyl-CoA desaturase
LALVTRLSFQDDGFFLNGVNEIVMLDSELSIRPESRNDVKGASAVAAGALKFSSAEGFRRELQRRVERYFRETGRRPRDCPQMYLKTAIILSSVAVCYSLLVFGIATWWLFVPLSLMLGLLLAAVGFNIQHDGSHGAYSNRGWINKIMAMSLDLLGGSSYVWARKHNCIHHSFANITGFDDDINLGLLGRLSPHQKRLSMHRFQHYYLWPFYGLLPIKWQAYDDFHRIITGTIGGHRLSRPRGWALATFIAGKIAFISLAFLIPLVLHSAIAVLLCYALVSFVQGVVLSVVFQLAHCVEEAGFPMPQPESGRMGSPWAEHQIETTVNFARGSRLLSWCLGGLNFQIEHHLFPRICHIHYPAISGLVEQTCREFQLRYAAHKSFFAAVASHYRWLRQMGAPGPCSS